MSTHRIRLTDEEMLEIGAALQARLAMRRGTRRVLTARLIQRLAECTPGNPAWLLGWDDSRDQRSGAAIIQDDPQAS